MGFERYSGGRERYRRLGLHSEHDIDGAIGVLSYASRHLSERDADTLTIVGGDGNIDFAPVFVQLGAGGGAGDTRSSP